MTALAALLALVCVQDAHASWPEDVSISAMTDYDGKREIAGLSEEYLQLVRELGTMVANQPLTPAETLGALGFEVSASNSFVFTSAFREEGVPTPWERAHVDETPASYHLVPRVGVRKGLPMSLEVGMDAGWLAMSRQGTLSGYGRVAIVEGYKPWPDISLQLGYAGYVGNDELELGVLDLTAILGSTYAFGSFPGIKSAQFSPFLVYSSLRISAHPLVSEEVSTLLDIGPVTGRKSDQDFNSALLVHRIGGGFQITNGTVLLRLSGSWAIQSLPSASLAMGFSY